MTPESVHKVLVNIRKTLDREKRQKNKNDGDEADDATEETPRKPQSESCVTFLFPYKDIFVCPVTLWSKPI